MRHSHERTDLYNQINQRVLGVTLLEQIRETSEGRKSRRVILLPARQCLAGRICHLIPLMFIVMTVETEQLPVASVGRIVVVVMVFVMNRELTQFLAVKFASAVRTDPWKQFERLLPIGLLYLSLGASCHASLEEGGDSVRSVSTNELYALASCLS